MENNHNDLAHFWTMILMHQRKLVVNQLEESDPKAATLRWLRYELDVEKLGLGDIKSGIEEKIEALEETDELFRDELYEFGYPKNSWFDYLYRDPDSIEYWVIKTILEDSFRDRGAVLWTFNIHHQGRWQASQIKEVSPERAVIFWLRRVFYERDFKLKNTEDDVQMAIKEIGNGSNRPTEMKGYRNIWYYEMRLSGVPMRIYIIATVGT